MKEEKMEERKNASAAAKAFMLEQIRGIIGDYGLPEEEVVARYISLSLGEVTHGQ